MTSIPFWEKPLAELTADQWEALCDGCARCCQIKLEDENTGARYITSIVCELLDQQSCRCGDYAQRAIKVPDCVVLDVEKSSSLDWMPSTCAYRLRAAGEALPDWHPLISGDPQSVHDAGISVRGKVISEAEVDEDEFEEYVIGKIAPADIEALFASHVEVGLRWMTTRAAMSEYRPEKRPLDSPTPDDDDSAGEWARIARHPPAGTIIQPSGGARMRAALLGVAMVVPMLALLPALNRYGSLGLATVAQPELLAEFENARGYLLLISSGVVLVIWFLAFALARLARNIREYRCYPPPGSHVLFPTKIIVGREVAAIQRFCNLAAVALLVLAVVFFFALIQLYAESTALLEVLSELAEMEVFQGFPQ